MYTDRVREFLYWVGWGILVSGGVEDKDRSEVYTELKGELRWDFVGLEYGDGGAKILVYGRVLYRYYWRFHTCLFFVLSWLEE